MPHQSWRGTNKYSENASPSWNLEDDVEKQGQMLRKPTVATTLQLQYLDLTLLPLLTCMTTNSYPWGLAGFPPSNGFNPAPHISGHNLHVAPPPNQFHLPRLDPLQLKAT